MSDQIVINVVQEAPANINVSDASQNINLNPLTLNQGIINHSVTHQSGGSDELLHNLLGGLNGGQSGYYYHLSSGQYFNLVTGSVVRPSETGNFITTSQTGAFYPLSNPSGFITGVDLSAYVTGDVVRPSQTGNFITTSQTGAFYPSSNPSGFITGLDTSAYVTGDVVRPSQTGDFYPRSNPSGFITGIDLSAYVTGDVVRPSETGSFITASQTGAFYAASNPSGFITGVDLSSYATQAYVTGASGSLQIQITNLGNQTGSYVLNSQTGNFITVGQTGAFYPNSNPSGFITGVDLSNYSTISYTTGISGGLQLQINALSLQTGSYALQSQTGSFLTTGAADNRFVSSSGNQTIYGTKSFSNDVYINRLYVTGSETIVATNNFSVQSPYVILNLTGGAVDGGIFFVTGSGLTGVNDLGPIIGFDHSTNFKFGISTRASDLSSLPTIGSVEQINALSGYLDPKITTLNNQTGSYALKSETGSFITTSQTGAFYAASNPSGFITGVDLSDYSTVDYATGISGSLQSQISLLESEVVYLTGNQNISGEKLFLQRPLVNGTGVMLSGEIIVQNFLPISGGSLNGNLTVSGSISATGSISSSSGIVVDNNRSISVRNNAGVSRSVAYMDPFNTMFIGVGAQGNIIIQPTQNTAIGSVIGNPASKLTIHGNASIGTSYSNIAAPTNGLIVAGNVGIGTSSPTERLAVSGNISASGTINGTNLVYNTGDQTIAGIKTFSNNIIGNGTLNTLPNQTAASTDQTCIATQVMTTPFPTFGGPPPMYKIFEDFPVQNANSSYIGTHGWYYAGAISNPAFATTSGALCYGAVTLTTAATSGASANIRLVTNGTNAVGGYMHALFAIPDPTNATFFMGFQGGGTTDSVQYTTLSGGWIVSKFTNPGFINNFIASGLLSGGNFTSGTRYKVSWGRPSDTTTTVHIASAPWNSAVWTTFYNGTISHSSWRGGFAQIQPYFGIAAESASARSVIVDYIGMEFTTQR